MTLKPEKWDLEVDFIAVGSGGGAITAAIIAYDLGKKAAVLKKAVSTFESLTKEK